MIFLWILSILKNSGLLILATEALSSVPERLRTVANELLRWHLEVVHHALLRVPEGLLMRIVSIICKTAIVVLLLLVSVVRRRIHPTNITIVAKIRRRHRLFILVVQHLLCVFLVRFLRLF